LRILFNKKFIISLLLEQFSYKTNTTKQTQLTNTTKQTQLTKQIQNKKYHKFYDRRKCGIFVFYDFETPKYSQIRSFKGVCFEVLEVYIFRCV